MSLHSPYSVADSCTGHSHSTETVASWTCRVAAAAVVAAAAELLLLLLPARRTELPLRCSCSDRELLGRAGTLMIAFSEAS